MTRMLLVVETITWKPHIETAMEIALRWREDGGEVLYCNLRRGLPACEDASPVHRALDLPEIRVRRATAILEEHGVRCARPEYSRETLAAAATHARRMLAGCRDEADLKALHYGDYHDIGWGVLSSVVSVTRDSTVTVASHRALLQRYLEAAILVYDATCALLDEHRPEQLLFFNGRFATTRAALRAAQSRGTPWRIHERGGDRDRYWLSDAMPHDMPRQQEKMLAQWDGSKAEAGRDFFEARRARIEREWHSFTKEQDHGRLPPELAEGEWVSFFTSSEDEMLAIGDSLSSERFPTQLDAIRVLAEACAAEGLRLCVRVHPHTRDKSRAEREKWQKLEVPGVLVIGPADRTDSYALIDRSKVVTTYASTVGIEATYWGKPSLLFAPSYYDRLGVSEQALDLEQIRAFLREPKVFPQERTLPYGAFWKELGEPYRYYRADGLHRGSICGVYLDDVLPMRAARALMGGGKRLLRLRR
jgi:hypothetical protein